MTTVVHVFHEARLVNRLQRAEAHRHGRELPEIRHQPGVRIGRQAFAVDVLAETVELIFVQATEQKRAGIDTGRRMALHEDQVATMRFGRRTPEVDEADVIQRGRRGEAGDVAAEIRVALVGAQHHRQRVPAHVGADLVLDGVVARRDDLAVGRNGIDVFGIGTVGLVDAGQAAEFDQALDEKVRALRAFLFDYRLEGVQPFAGFLAVGVEGCPVVIVGGHVVLPPVECCMVHA